MDVMGNLMSFHDPCNILQGSNWLKLAEIFISQPVATSITIGQIAMACVVEITIGRMQWLMYITSGDACSTDCRVVPMTSCHPPKFIYIYPPSKVNSFEPYIYLYYLNIYIYAPPNKKLCPTLEDEGKIAIYRLSLYKCRLKCGKSPLPGNVGVEGKSS